MIQPTRFVIGLGLIASSLTVTTVARADIPITGGQVSGEAAFFTQTNISNTTTLPTLTRTGQPVLFDTVIQTLRIVTPNGTTTTSRFLPNAARFTDVNGNSRPDGGDTGRLEGALSGVAFNRVGSPVFFQNIPTALNFTLTSFNPVFTDIGSLISPRQEGTAPLLFLPRVNVTLSESSNSTYNSRLGLLETGAFAGNLTGDFIGLPSDLQLRPAAGDVTFIPLFSERRVKFDFRGNNAEVDRAAFGENPLGGSDELTFAGEVTDFQVQSVGTAGTREFKVTGSGTLDITLSGPFDIRRDSLDLNGLTQGDTIDYRIQGEGPGFVGFTGSNSIAYSGVSRRETKFNFEQGDNRFEGRSDGNVSFTVSDRNDNIDFRNPAFRFTVPVVGINTVTAVGTPFVSSSLSGASVTTSTTSTFVFTTTVFNTTSINIFPAYRNLLIEQESDDDDDDDDDDNEGYGSNVVYYVYGQRTQATEVVIERQGDRILVVDRTPVRGRKLKKRGQVISAYQVVGLPSRVFPGLTGLRQIPAEQVPAASLDESGTEAAATTETQEQAAVSPSEATAQTNAVSSPTGPETTASEATTQPTVIAAPTATETATTTSPQN